MNEETRGGAEAAGIEEKSSGLSWSTWATIILGSLVCGGGYPVRFTELFCPGWAVAALPGRAGLLLGCRLDWQEVFQAKLCHLLQVGSPLGTFESYSVFLVAQLGPDQGGGAPGAGQGQEAQQGEGGAGARGSGEGRQ